MVFPSKNPNCKKNEEVLQQFQTAFKPKNWCRSWQIVPLKIAKGRTGMPSHCLEVRVEQEWSC